MCVTKTMNLMDSRKALRMAPDQTTRKSGQAPPYSEAKTVARSTFFAPENDDSAQSGVKRYLRTRNIAFGVQKSGKS